MCYLAMHLNQRLLRRYFPCSKCKYFFTGIKRHQNYFIYLIFSCMLPKNTPVRIPLAFSIGIPASSRALYVHCNKSLCWGSMVIVSALVMPKNLWSNSFKLHRIKGEGVIACGVQTLQRKGQFQHHSSSGDLIPNLYDLFFVQQITKDDTLKSVDSKLHWTSFTFTVWVKPTLTKIAWNHTDLEKC